MFTNLIENRGKEFSNLLKIGDYLGRTLRQNVELFSVEGPEVTYITESGHVVRGSYILKPALRLINVVVESSNVLEDQKVFEKVVEGKISGLLSNLLEDNYKTAEGSFDKILSMFETKLSYARVKSRLEDKTERFGTQTKIMESDEFSRLFEMRDKLLNHLKTNKSIMSDAAVKNGVKLSNLVAGSFDMPKLTIDQLKESNTITVATGLKSSVYEYLCRKELVQKELIESKSSFDKMWVNHEGIHSLASLVLESNDKTVRTQVAKVITELPYFTLATKKQLNSLVKNSLSLAEVEVSNKDVNSFVNKVYALKKPVKTIVLKTLNEKYGIDVKKLDEVPTFRTLLMTEAEILKRIAYSVDKKSVLYKSLVEMAESLKIKNGTESIDLANFLNELFTEAGYTKSINETSLMSYMDFSRVADDLGKIGQVLKMLSPLMSGEGGMGGEGGMDPMAALGADPAAADPAAGVDPMGAVTPGEEMGAGTPPQDPLGSPDPYDADSENPGMESGGAEEVGPDAQNIADEILGDGDPMPGEEMPAIPGEEEGIPGEEEEMIPGEEGEEGMEFGEDEFLDDEEEGMEGQPVEEDEMTAKLTQIQDLLASILGDEGGEFETGEEEEGFEDDGEEFEDDGEEFEDSDDDGEFEEEEEDFPPKKKKPSPFK
tara:strand:- start:215 stop:2188 length:1974 start_codon:yes stop_codon:yes gene_type:complete